MAWDEDIAVEDRPFWHTTVFHPDHCQCRMRFAWDTRNPPVEGGPVIPAKIEHACEAHEHLQKAGVPVAEFWAEVHGENVFKCQVVDAIKEHIHDDHCLIMEADDGSKHRILRRDPKVSYTDKRELVLELDKNVTAAEKRELAAAIKKKFGGRKTHLR